LWAEVLYTWLIEYGFKPTQSSPALLILRTANDALKILVYIDKYLYHSRLKALLDKFKKDIQSRFQVKMMGQAHWFLQARLTHHGDKSITLDQS
jgi:hypothetical protein